MRVQTSVVAVETIFAVFKPILHLESWVVVVSIPNVPMQKTLPDPTILDTGDSFKVNTWLSSDITYICRDNLLHK